MYNHLHLMFHLFFFFNDTATTEIYTLSLHDALPILEARLGPLYEKLRLPPNQLEALTGIAERRWWEEGYSIADGAVARSEEHTSELQSRQYLVCRLLLEKKKKKK